MNHFDAMEKVMQDAEQRVLTAGLSGGEVHESVDWATIMMATMSWSVREIKDSNAKLAKELMGSDASVKSRVKKHAPAAGAGAIIVGALGYLRDFFS